MISVAVKPETASEKVKVTVAASPDFNALLSEVMVRVGDTVSPFKATVLLTRLLLPAASAKAPAAMLTVPLRLLVTEGVKVAVYFLLSALSTTGVLMVPLVTATSLTVKPTGASVNVKVSVAVPPVSKVELLAVINTSGALVSKLSEGVAPALPGLPAVSV